MTYDEAIQVGGKPIDIQAQETIPAAPVAKLTYEEAIKAGGKPIPVQQPQNIYSKSEALPPEQQAGYLYEQPFTRPSAAVPETGLWAAAKGGLTQSSAGLGYRIAAGEKGMPAPYQPQGFLEKLAMGAGELAGDIPAMIGGGVAGSAVPIVGTTAGALMAPAAIKETEKAYLAPETTSLGKAAKEVAIAGTVGKLMEFVGGATFLRALAPEFRPMYQAAVKAGDTLAARSIITAAQASGKFSPMIAKAVTPAAEIATMGTAEPLIREGRLPTAEELALTALPITGLHMAGKVGGAIKSAAVPEVKPKPVASVAVPPIEKGGMLNEPAVRKQFAEMGIEQPTPGLAEYVTQRPELHTPEVVAEANRIKQDMFAPLKEEKGAISVGKPETETPPIDRRAIDRLDTPKSLREQLDIVRERIEFWNKEFKPKNAAEEISQRIEIERLPKIEQELTDQLKAVEASKELKDLGIEPPPVSPKEPVSPIVEKPPIGETPPVENLRPAIQTRRGLLEGVVGESHIDILKRTGTKESLDHSKGFITPDGQFLNRKQAMDWLKDNQPEVAAKLKEQGVKALHTEDYNAAVKEVTRVGRQAELSPLLAKSSDSLLRAYNLKDISEVTPEVVTKMSQDLNLPEKVIQQNLGLPFLRSEEVPITRPEPPKPIADISTTPTEETLIQRYIEGTLEIPEKIKQKATEYMKKGGYQAPSKIRERYDNYIYKHYIQKIARSELETPPVTAEVPPETKLYGGGPSTEEILKTGKQSAGDIIDKAREFIQTAKRSFGHPFSEVEAAKGAMLKHHEVIRDSAWMNNLITKWGIQQYDKLGVKLGDKDKIETQTNILLATEDPELKAQLPREQQTMLNHAEELQKSITKYAVDNGLITAEVAAKHPNYIKHWLIDPKTGEPFSPFWGQFSKSGPSMKERTFGTYKEAMAAGYQPATLNVAELVGKSYQEVHRIVETRKMLATIRQIESPVGGEMLRSAQGELKPMRIMEPWSRLIKQNKTDGYTKFDHRLLDYAIHYKDQDGVSHIIEGPVGVRKEFLPWVRAYIENPTYSKAEQLNNMFKTGKMTSGFHIISLTANGLAGGRGIAGKMPIENVIRGLKEAEVMSPELRVLNKCGLDAFKRINYEDIGRYHNMLYGGGLVKKTITFVPREMTALTFDVVHRGLSVSLGLDIFRDMKQRAINRVERPLTVAEETEIGYKAVDIVTNMLSGGDAKSKMLRATEWMAKYWYSPEARQKWQFGLLSPSWQRAHIAIAKEILKSVAHPMALESKYYRGYVYGAIGVYAAANLYNYFMTQYLDGEGKWMFENPNPWVVRMPWNNPDGSAVYGRLLKSIFEIPEAIQDLSGRVIAKVSPPIGAALHYYKDRLAKSNTELAKDFVKDLALPMAAQRTEEWMKGKAALPTALAPVIGVPMTASKAHTPAEVAASRYMTKKYSGLFQQTKESELRKNIVDSFRRSPYIDMLPKKERAFYETLSETTRRRLRNEAQLGYLEGAISHLSIDEAFEVYKKANPEERQKLFKHIQSRLRDVPSDKRDAAILKWRALQ
jgi:hypothetical protein